MAAMTLDGAAERLGWLVQRARGLSDVTYTTAVLSADRREVAAADTEQAATALMDRFLSIAERMQEMDVDHRTYGQAMALAECEMLVAQAARALRQAAEEARQARERLARQRARASDPDDKTGFAEVEAAAQKLRWAESRHKEAAKALAARIRDAADAATALRRGLSRRHGGVNEAHASAPVQAAEREFYESGR